MDINTPQQSNTVTLAIQTQAYLAQRLSEEFIRSSADIVNVPWCEDAIMRLRAFMLGETLRSKTWRWPADWWQHFKERWFPAWARQRWPVVYQWRRVDIDAVYPELSKRVSLPREQHYLRIAEHPPEEAISSWLGDS